MESFYVDLLFLPNTGGPRKYQIVRKLAVGGMAEIFLARATGIQGFEKYIVIKKLHRERALSDRAVEMFLDEGRLVAQLQHHNIAQVYDIGHSNGEYFITMEYLQGQDVRTMLKRCRRDKIAIPLENALSIVARVAAGLHYAHSKVSPSGKPLNIVHRDVSPCNVFVTYEGGVKLVDFGIAWASERTFQTREGTLKGKIRYMSPEQVRGMQVDRRSDIFSLGIMLYELSTMAWPFGSKGDSDFAIMERIVRGPVQPPSQHLPGYPAQLEAIVMRALAKQPYKRYSSAKEMLVDIEQFAAGAKLPLSSAALASFLDQLFGVPDAPPIESLLYNDTEPMENIAAAITRSLKDTPNEQPDSCQVGVSDSELASEKTRVSDHERSSRVATVPTESSMFYPPTPTSALPTPAVNSIGIRVADLDPISAQFSQPDQPLLALQAKSRRWPISLLALLALVLVGGIVVPLTIMPKGQGELLRSDAAKVSVQPTALSDRHAPANQLEQATVTLRLDIVPANATVELDGEPVSGGAIELPRSGGTHRLEISARGFAPVSETLIANSDRNVVVRLQPTPQAGQRVDRDASEPAGDSIADRAANKSVKKSRQVDKKKIKSKRKSKRKRRSRSSRSRRKSSPSKADSGSRSQSGRSRRKSGQPAVQKNARNKEKAGKERRGSELRDRQR
ncbi:MAG: protein kinase [Proteobacteria bacterium]|nr:protein kinase [Pseudomonadota bacterium]